MPELNVPNGDIILALYHRITGYSRDLVCTVGIGIDEGEPFDQAAVNGLFTNWANSMKPCVAPELTFTKAIAYWKQPLGYVPFVSNSAPIVGTSSGTCTTPNTAVMIEKQTGRPGRAGRGRMFMPGVSETFISPNGDLSGAILTQFGISLAAVYAFQTAGASIFDDVLLYHQDDNVDPTPTIVNSYVANARVSSQAKRFRR